MWEKCSVLQMQIALSVIVLFICLVTQKCWPDRFIQLQQQYIEYVLDDAIIEQEPVRFVMSKAVKVTYPEQ